MKKLYLFLALTILCATAVAQECNQPEWPESDIINETTVRVHWPAVAGAQFYRLYHYDGDGNLLLSTTTTDTAYTFTNLPLHSYFWGSVSTHCSDYDESLESYYSFNTASGIWRPDEISGFSYEWWTPLGNSWSIDYNGMAYNDASDSTNTLLFSPRIAIPLYALDSLMLSFVASALINAELSVFVTTDSAISANASFDTLLHTLVYPGASASAWGNNVPFSLMLNAYAGQTIRVVFCHHGASTAFVHTLMGDGAVELSDVQIRSALTPVVDFSVAPSLAFVGESVTFEAAMTEGSTNGLTFSWRSQMADAGMAVLAPDSLQCSVIYSASGTDTLYLTAANAYDTVTISTVVRVVDCSPVTAMPWQADLANGFDCWRNLGQASWTSLCFNGNTPSEFYALKLGGSSAQQIAVIATPSIHLPADTAGLRLYWEDVRALTAYANVPYRVLVSTGQRTDLSTYDTLPDEFNTQSTSWTQRSIDLSAYAGQTVSLAFAARQPGSSWKYLYIANIEIWSDRMPDFSLDGPSAARADSSQNLYEAIFTRGLDTAATYQWHSTMAAQGLAAFTVQNSQFIIQYYTPGTDTITLTLSTPFGTTTHSRTVTVTQCTPIVTYPWEEGFDDEQLSGCWTSVDFLYYSLIWVDNTTGFRRASTPGSYMVTPQFSVPADSAQQLCLMVECLNDSPSNGTVAVRLTTANSDDTTLFLPEEPLMDYARDEFRQHRVRLDNYGGQTLRAAILYRGSGEVVVNTVRLEYDTLPRGIIADAPQAVWTDSLYTLHARLSHGVAQNLTFDWHSTMAASGHATLIPLGDNATIEYYAGGTDTLRLISTTSYGSDTAYHIVEVSECGLVNILPWTDDFEAGMECWLQPDGDHWTLGNSLYLGYDHEYHIDNHFLSSTLLGTTYDSRIVSRPIRMPNDADSIELSWQDAGFGSWNQLYVMVCTGEVDDYTSYDTLYTHPLSGGYGEHHHVSLAPYAGQTIRLAFCDHPSQGGNPFQGANIHIDNIRVRDLRAPMVSIHSVDDAFWAEWAERTNNPFLPTLRKGRVRAYVGEPIRMDALVTEGSATAYSWHSQRAAEGLATVNAQNAQFTIEYSATGVDTITVTATSPYGSASASMAVIIDDCAPIDSLPWEPTFSHNSQFMPQMACWHVWDFDTLMGSNWSTSQVSRPNQGMSAMTVLWSPAVSTGHANDWLVLPAIHFSDSAEALDLYWNQLALGDGQLQVRISTSGADDTSRFIYRPAEITEPLASDLRFVTHIVPLDQFAGQTVHIALVHQGVFEHNASLYGLGVRSNLLPVLNLSAPSRANAGEPARLQAGLGRFVRRGLVVDWHSAMASRGQATLADMEDSLDITYHVAGTDTVTLTVSNEYGTTMATAVIQVTECTVRQLPWVENFQSVTPSGNDPQENLPECWYWISEGTAPVPPQVVASGWRHSATDNALSLVAGASDTLVYALLPPFADTLGRLQVTLWHGFAPRNQSTSQPVDLSTYQLSVGLLRGEQFIPGAVLTPGLVDADSGLHGRVDTVTLAADRRMGDRVALRWLCTVSVAQSICIDNIIVSHSDSVDPGPVYYTLTVATSDSTMGRVYGGGSFLEGSEVEIRAYALSGYRFLQWNDGDTLSRRTVRLTSDTLFTAYFDSIPVGIDNSPLTTLHSPLIYPNPATHSVTVQTDEQRLPAQLTLYAADGRRVLSRTLTAASTAVDLSQLAPGAYYCVLIHEAGTTTQKLIVTR